MEDGETFGQDKDRSLLLDDTVIILSQEQLRQVRVFIPLDKKRGFTELLVPISCVLSRRSQ